MRSISRPLVAAFAVALVTLGLSGCGLLPVGPAVTEQREVDAGVHAVRIETGGELVVTRGDDPGLTVTAPGNVIEWLGSESVDGVLVLSRPPGPWILRTEVRYELTLPVLDELEVVGSGDVTADFGGAESVRIAISGSGDVDAAGIDAGELTITIDGAGDVALGSLVADAVSVSIRGAGAVSGSGTARAQELSIRGAGDIDLAELVVETSVVEVSGAGDVTVHVTEQLRASIDGSGSIRYRGDPEVDSRISGAGSVSRE